MVDFHRFLEEDTVVICCKIIQKMHPVHQFYLICNSMKMQSNFKSFITKTIVAKKPLQLLKVSMDLDMIFIWP
jgi:hypothetical protein